MFKNYLEDIVEEEKRFFDKGKKNLLRKYLDHPIIKNPALTYITTIISGIYAINYIDKNHEELVSNANFPSLILASYILYSTLGIIKEYILENKELRIKKNNLKKWVKENPKIIGILGAIAGSIIAYKGVENIQNIIGIKNEGMRIEKLIYGMTLGGLLSETIVRGLKNMGEIKKNIKKRETTTKEKIWNFTFENPMILPIVATLATFKKIYENPESGIVRIGKEYGVKYGKDRVAYILTDSLLENIIEYPEKIIGFFMQSGIIGSITFGALLTTGSLLHSQSLKESKLRIKKNYYKLIKNEEKTIKSQEEIISLPKSNEKTIEDLVELGNLYFPKDREEAYNNYRQALRIFSKKQDELSYSDLFRKTFKLNTLTKLINKIKKRTSDEERTINKMFISLLNKDDEALEEIKKFVEKDEENPESRYMYGKALEILGYKKSGAIQKIKAIKKAREKETELKTFEKSKNKVVLLEGKVLHGEIVGKEAELEDLVREEKITKELREIIIDFEKYDTPIPLGKIEIKEKIYYAMEYIQAESLKSKIEKYRDNTDKEEKIKAKRYLKEKIKEITDFMGLIHAKIKTDKEKKEYNLTEGIIRKRLEDAKVEEEKIKAICTNLYPMYTPIRNIEEITNKDAHPGNWLIDNQGNISAIDLEGDRIMPLTDDTANLLDLQSFLDEKEKEEILKEHLKSFKKYSEKKTTLNFKEYHLAYLHSAIMRNLMIYTMDLKDKKLNEEAKENIKEATSRIEKSFNNYYEANKESYKSINKTLEEIKINE